MSHFLETICIEQGQVHNLPYHLGRIMRTLNECGVELSAASWSLLTEPLFANHAALASTGRTKCRLLYGTNGLEEVSYTPYHVRPVTSIQLVAAPGLDYHLKYANRDALNQLFQQRKSADEVLIVQNDCLTDTSIANVALYNGTQWITPLHPLLKGTKRTQLLADGVLTEGVIRVADLSQYSHIRCFNALIGWGEVELPISAIYR